MPRCPASNCHRVWQWDWEQDLYRQPNGTVCNVYKVRVPNVPTTEAMVCQCGQVLGWYTVDGDVFTHSEWEGTDWESQEHAYDPYQKGANNECSH